MTAAVVLELDTTAPDFYVERAEDIVRPPKDWAGAIVSAESIGSVTVVLRTSSGQVIPIGTERRRDAVVGVLVPGASLTGGPATLTLFVRDLVGNVSRQDLDLEIVTVINFELSLHDSPIFVLAVSEATVLDLMEEDVPVFLLEMNSVKA